MTPTEATDLASRIHRQWRNGPPADAWEEDLLELDIGRATTTFVKLRRTEEHPPSFARFFSTYRALDTTDAGNRPAPCSLCDGTGWVEARNPHRADLYGDHGGRPCTCHAVEKCTACQARKETAA